MKVTSSNGMLAAMLAIGTLMVSTVPAMAQDNSTPQTAPAGAQDGGPGSMGGHHDPAQMEQHQLDMMTKRLSLTPDQVTQVKAIDDAQRTQMMALRGDTSMSREDKHGKMMAMRQDRESKIRAVLTDDQKPKYDAMLAKEHERMENHQGGHGGPPEPPPAQ